MSTSHYSSGPTWPPGRRTAPNTRRHTAGKLIAIGALLLVDVVAFGATDDLGIATTFAALAILNCWVIARYAR